MGRASALALLGAVASVALTALGGCFGGDDGSSDALHATTIDTRVEAQVEVERIVYTSSDGRRVPALFAMPRGVSPRGCLIWQNGLNSRRQDSAEFWDGAARLGLAVFTIRLRRHGVRGSVADLRRGIDYLERRRDCRKNIGYGGLGIGGMIGGIVAGRDPRIRATVIISAPPTWRSLLAAQGAGKTRLRTAERNLSPLDPKRWIGRISPRPVLVLTGRKDPLVPPRAAAQMAAAARPPKRIVSYRGSRGPFRGPDAARNDFLIGDFLLKWLVKPTYPS
jgi:pimeloyl-ACP methyl ester carboxylesterase